MTAKDIVASTLTVVMDSHRPVHHNNVRDMSGNLLVIDDADFADCPTLDDIDEMKEGESDDEEAMFGDDDEKENIGVTPDVVEEEEDMDLLIGKKRAAKLMNQKRQKQKSRNEKKTKIEKYYSGSYFSESVAGIAYHLSRQLNQETSDFLWLWMLGATEMLVGKKITSQAYVQVKDNCTLEKNRFGKKETILNSCILPLTQLIRAWQRGTLTKPFKS